MIMFRETSATAGFQAPDHSCRLPVIRPGRLMPSVRLLPSCGSPAGASPLELLRWSFSAGASLLARLPAGASACWRVCLLWLLSAGAAACCGSHSCLATAIRALSDGFGCRVTDHARE
jgi:hypothetical protein